MAASLNAFSPIPSNPVKTDPAIVVSEESHETNSAVPASAYGPSSADQPGFVEIISRDERLPIPATSYVPQNTVADTRVRITLQENETYIGNGVMYKGFTIDDKIPGPTIIVNEGDVVEFTIVNDGILPHGASIHAASTQTSKYLGKIMPGDSSTIVFRVNMPGVYMYHCAPGAGYYSISGRHNH